MNDNNKIIEEHVKKERIKNIFYIFIAVVPFLLISIFFIQTGEVTEVKGVVTRLAGSPSDDGNNLYIVVKLSNYKKVRAYIDNTSFYRKGKTVILFERKMIIFGNKTYKFKQYVK